MEGGDGGGERGEMDRGGEGGRSVFLFVYIEIQLPHNTV